MSQSALAALDHFGHEHNVQTKIGGYELIRRLACGGMAELFLARRPSIANFDRLVVVKRILPHYINAEQFVSMFLDEAQLMSTLQHPNIVQVQELGHDVSGYYFVMEYVRGVDLRKLLRDCSTRRRRIPLAHALRMVVDVAAGLHAAHTALGADGASLGIVHRDISPANVIVSYDGTSKLLDFGVAMAKRRRSQTLAGVRKGKVRYMSPEQLRGEPLDARSDIFCLGIVLWELTCGRPLFTGHNEYSVAEMVLQREILRPSQVVSNYPLELESIVMSALERDRASRTVTARDLQLALEYFAVRHGLVLSTATLGDYITEQFLHEKTLWGLLDASGPDGEPDEIEEADDSITFAEPPRQSTSTCTGVTCGKSLRLYHYLLVGALALLVALVGSMGGNW